MIVTPLALDTMLVVTDHEAPTISSTTHTTCFCGAVVLTFNPRTNIQAPYAWNCILRVDIPGEVHTPKKCELFSDDLPASGAVSP